MYLKMTQQKSINNKIERLNMYYKNRSHAWSDKKIKNSLDYPFLILKTNIYTVPFVFIIFMGHIVVSGFPIEAFIFFVFFINCGVVTIVETNYQLAWRVRCVQFVLLPKTDG